MAESMGGSQNGGVEEHVSLKPHKPHLFSPKWQTHKVSKAHVEECSRRRDRYFPQLVKDQTESS